MTEIVGQYAPDTVGRGPLGGPALYGNNWPASMASGMAETLAARFSGWEWPMLSDNAAVAGWPPHRHSDGSSPYACRLLTNSLGNPAGAHNIP